MGLKRKMLVGNLQPVTNQPDGLTSPPGSSLVSVSHPRSLSLPLHQLMKVTSLRPGGSLSEAIEDSHTLLALGWHGGR